MCFKLINDCCGNMNKSERAAFEKKLMFGFTALTILGFLMEIIAVSTDSWLLFYIEGGLYQNATSKYIHRVYSGLWRICKVTRTKNDDPSTEATKCDYHNFFPTTKEIIYDKSIDQQILDYMRTGCAFSIISMTLMFLVHLFAVYTIRRPRYTIKRLTALLHFMTAACIVVMNEVFIRTTEYADEHLPARIPRKAEHDYGYSFVLSWIVFVFYLCAGVVFLFLSQKRKAKMADSDDDLAVEDEPVRLRR
ncbi:epithelial membrane protein 2-like [Mya arenaria]|uniref:epithelial membrane protein 2-like n=1 Tax=Mya arenaria TaxID=6604 RepID=UPI0022E4F900|nr:epithelial membrane protein 2-like [Mya arenaria]